MHFKGNPGIDEEFLYIIRVAHPWILCVTAALHKLWHDMGKEKYLFSPMLCWCKGNVGAFPLGTTLTFPTTKLPTETSILCPHHHCNFWSREEEGSHSFLGGGRGELAHWIMGLEALTLAGGLLLFQTSRKMLCCTMRVTRDPWDLEDTWRNGFRQRLTG